MTLQENPKRGALRFTGTLLLLGTVLLLGGSLLRATKVEGEENSLPWITDIRKAKTQAAAQGKDLFINFTGSDWCVWCKRLEAEVFAEESFVRKATENFVFLFQKQLGHALAVRGVSVS